jgi:predicted kinase
MINLKINVGISGSGKSTATHNAWLFNPLNTLIVNRDKIRELLFGYTEETIGEYYKLFDENTELFYQLEKDVTSVQERIVKDAIVKMKSRTVSSDGDFTIYIDDTNLSVNYINKWLSLVSNYDGSYREVTAEIVWYDVELEEAIHRDSQRLRKVGAEVITRQYERYVEVKTFFTNQNKLTNG